MNSLIIADDECCGSPLKGRLGVSLVAASLLALGASAAAPKTVLPSLNETLGTAYARTDGSLLVVGTGKVERKWKCTAAGLVTVGFEDLAAKRQWADVPPAFPADWSAPGWIDEQAKGELISLKGMRSDDEQFTSEHLRIVAEIAYPDQQATIRYEIWAYPGAAGFRTQCWVKGRPAGALASQAVSKTDSSEERRTDYLPITPKDLKMKAVGYYNDTQHRNRSETPVIREEIAQGPVIDWANMVSLADDKGGILMLKESHKCVNQPGVDTGVFRVNEQGLQNTGWSFAPDDGKADSFQWCWATWTIAYAGGDDERELALKALDRLRYPVNAQRDLWTVACSWGHALNPRDGRNYAQEHRVLPEMQSVADLGIDMLLIDAGWAVSATAMDDNSKDWKPSPDIYPEGWKNVIALKARLGIRLGLWGIAQRMPASAMAWNWDQLKLGQLKLDYARLHDHQALDQMMQTARAFIKHTAHQSIISWDVTERAPRYGYYWAREYGDVHFMNRQPMSPTNAIYIPWLALRDFWHLAKYNNLNKWQLVTTVPRDVNPNASDANQHSVAYCTATTLMGIPEFLANTRFFKGEDRNELRQLLGQYKKVRRDIFDRYVFPIGDEPSNRNWSGFQANDPASDRGILLLFREIGNADETKRIKLRFLKNTRIETANVRTGARQAYAVGSDGTIEFTLKHPADFLFLEYTESSGPRPRQIGAAPVRN